MLITRYVVASLSALVLAVWSFAPARPVMAATAEVDAAYPKAYALYVDLHEHPELSGYETRTAAKLAAELRGLGYTVTEHVGGTGVVAILRNGPGKTVMLRTELDALPVEEQTGLAYASKVHAKDAAGRDVRGRAHVRTRSAHERSGGHRRHHGAQPGFLARHPDPHRPTGRGDHRRRERDGARRPLHALSASRRGACAARRQRAARRRGRVLRRGVYDSNADSLRITIYGRAGMAPRRTPRWTRS